MKSRMRRSVYVTQVINNALARANGSKRRGQFSDTWQVRLQRIGGRLTGKWCVFCDREPQRSVPLFDTRSAAMVWLRAQGVAGVEPWMTACDGDREIAAAKPLPMDLKQAVEALLGVRLGRDLSCCLARCSTDPQALARLALRLMQSRLAAVSPAAADDHLGTLDTAHGHPGKPIDVGAADNKPDVGACV